MGNTFYFAWEPALMHWLQAHMNAAAVGLASFVTLFGEEIAMVVILGFIYWCYNKKMGIYLATNFCMVGILNPMIKNVFMRRRPYFDNPQVACLKPVDSSADLYDINAQGYSFPSGHSSNSAVVYGSIARFSGKRWVKITALVITLAVGCSRFCLGVHYPTDVLCGWLLGVFGIFFFPWLQSKFPHKWMFYLLMVVIALPGCFFCQTTDYYTGLGMMIGFFAGNLVEEKYVRFENTTHVGKILLRLLFGGIIYFGLNILLKMPFDADFLASATAGAYAIRVVRYAINLFVIVAIYPMAFDKIGRKKSEAVTDLS
jgi:membrane-associated phospholipid phosphatase